MMQDSLRKDMSFDSERLHYRGINRGDADRIVAWRSSESNYRYFADPRPLSKEDHLVWFERYLQDDARFDFMILDEEHKPIGVVGLSDIKGDSCEVNYIIGDEEARGSGYASEAVRAVMGFAERALGIKRMTAIIKSDNEASMHVAQACGFQEWGKLYRFAREEA